MINKRIYTSEFRNRWGDQWIFEYDYVTGQGTLKGSDADWESYPVVNGMTPDIVLNDQEIRWLRKAWAESVVK